MRQARDKDLGKLATKVDRALTHALTVIWDAYDERRELILRHHTEEAAA